MTPTFNAEYLVLNLLRKFYIATYNKRGDNVNFDSFPLNLSMTSRFFSRTNTHDIKQALHTDD